MLIICVINAFQNSLALNNYRAKNNEEGMKEVNVFLKSKIVFYFSVCYIIYFM